MTTPPAQRHVRDHARSLVIHPARRRPPAAPDLATVRQAVTGARRRLADTPFLTARHLWLHTDPPLDLDVHGEIRGRTPAQITLEANALRVMVSTDFPDVCGSPFAATIEDAAAAGQRDRTQPN